MPWRTAKAAAAAREGTPSLARMLATWLAPIAEQGDQLGDEGETPALHDAECAGDCGQDQVGVRDRRQGDDGDPVREGRFRGAGDREGEAGLAHAARTEERDEGDLVPGQEGEDSRHLGAAADKRRPHMGNAREFGVQGFRRHCQKTPGCSGGGR